MNPPGIGALGVASTLPKWSEPVGGLLAATVVASLAYSPPPRQVLSWPGLIGMAAERVFLVFLVFLACAATVWGLSLIRPEKSNRRRHRLTLRTSLDAIWLTPFVLLVSKNSTWAMAIAVVLGVSLTTSFRSLQQPRVNTGTAESLFFSLSNHAFRPPHSSPSHWDLFPAIGAGLCTEAGVIVGSTGYPLLAAMLVGVGSAFWTSSITRYREFPASRESAWRVLAAIGLVIVVTVASLTMYAKRSDRFGGLGFASSSNVRRGLHLWWRNGDVRPDKEANGSDSAFSDAYSGIVLWPKKQAHTTLVAPAPILANSFFSSDRIADTVVIPFEGVYWFFRPPDSNPPTGSHQAYGSPDMFNTRSTDRRALSIEAHQNLGAFIDLDCCSRIKIAIRNTDRYPESIYLELILKNTSLPGKPSQSLGSAMIKSTPPWKLYGDRPPVSETLSFALPMDPAIPRFDEIAVVFHLDPGRAQFGARIGIDRFVLVPRGL